MSVQQAAKLILLPIANNQSKLLTIAEISSKHFYHKETLLILVPSDEAAHYIDQLLWKLPEESFIPHAIIHSRSSERVAISTAKANLNQAQVLLNLRPEAAVEVSGPHMLIYDLIDHSSPAKLELSQKRETAYRAAGF